MLLRHIRYFLAVAEHGNFTRAAEALHVSQPTLSQQIRQLEEELRTQLFDRSARKVQLTDSGTAWMRYARLALQDLDAGARAIHDTVELSRGLLRLAITPTFSAYLIGPLVDRFQRLYPGISIALQELTQDRIEALLGEDQLDIGIAFKETHLPEIEASKLFVETLSVMVGKAHPQARRRKALSKAEFEQQPLALLNDQFATRLFINQYCRKSGINPRVAIESNSIGAIVEMVRCGHLATILPDQVAREHPELYAIALTPPMPSRTAALLQRKGAYQTAAAKAFVGLLKEMV